MDYKITGRDNDGVTRISLEALEAYKEKKLEFTLLENEKCIFVFKDHTAYEASGFSWGYSGEGPRGLHTAIRMFSDGINEDFNKTAISMLPMDKNWVWSSDSGFVHR